MDLIQFGGLLQSLRKEQGLTQEQLAEQFGVGRRTVSRRETGSNLPDIDVLIALADFYQIDLRKAARFRKTLPLGCGSVFLKTVSFDSLNRPSPWLRRKISINSRSP